MKSPSKEQAAYWADRAIGDLVIYRNKLRLQDAKKHLEWALQEVNALLAAKATITVKTYEKVFAK